MNIMVPMAIMKVDTISAIVKYMKTFARLSGSSIKSSRGSGFTYVTSQGICTGLLLGILFLRLLHLACI